jgi:glycosyltransferase domain-containing protein
MAAGYTVLVPTYNRPPFLERLFRYFLHARLDAPILIADGSQGEALAKNKALVAKYRDEGLDIGHFIPPPDPQLVGVGSCRFGYAPRLNLALREVTTPYVDLVCDDCFVSPEFLNAAARLLDGDSSISTVVGQMWTMTLDRERESTSLYGSIQEFNLAGTGGLKAGNTAVERLIANIDSAAMNSLWAMHRRDNLALVFGVAQSAIDALIGNAKDDDLPGPAEEWALDFLHGTMVNMVAMISGGVRYVPHLMLGHQYHADNWGLQLSRGPRLDDAVMRRYWTLISAPYISGAAALAVKADGIAAEEAGVVVQAFLCKDMARRMSHAANLKVQSLGTQPVAKMNESLLRRILRKIPGLRMVAIFVGRAPSLYRKKIQRGRDRKLSDVPEIRLLRNFIETAGAR